MSKKRKVKDKRLVLTSQFHVNKLQKQLQSVKQIHLDQSVNFGPLFLFVCVTINHDDAFNNINRKGETKCNKSRQTHKRSIETNFF